MTVLIVDYGMGNLASARRAFEECGVQVQISADPDDLAGAARIVVPGVGSFARAMGQLNERGWIQAIGQAAQADIPVLGICLGMQILADEGFEGGHVRGLGLIAGRVERMTPTNPAERVPHVGWNEVNAAPNSPLFDGIAAAEDFYFVHSYHFVASDPTTILATTPYCGSIAAAVGKANIFGVQFHPEKSSRAGFRLIANFLKL